MSLKSAESCFRRLKWDLEERGLHFMYEVSEFVEDLCPVCEAFGFCFQGKESVKSEHIRVVRIQLEIQLQSFGGLLLLKY